MKTLSLTIAALVAATPLAAQSLRDCDTFEANARNTYPPYEETIREYANGAIRVIALDAGEPAAAAFHVMVTHPLPDDPFPGCTLISLQDQMGFGGLGMDHVQAHYNAELGLVLIVPFTTWLENSQLQLPGELAIIVNQATGSVTVDALSADLVAPVLEPEVSK